MLNYIGKFAFLVGLCLTVGWFRTPARAEDVAVTSGNTAKADVSIVGSTTQAAPQAPVRKPLIVIDAGHGGYDPGATAPGGVKEKDVVFAVAQALKADLLDTGKFNVAMTRQGDKFVSLDERVKFARDGNADLMIAIHADTLEDSTVNGTTIYTVSNEASDAVAEAIAKRENREDFVAGTPLAAKSPEVASALLNLAQRETRAESLRFANEAYAEAKNVTYFTAKPLRSAAFVVLKAPDVPSVLIELGYLSNAHDRELLKYSKWRQQMAQALSDAVEKHFEAALTASK